MDFLTPPSEVPELTVTLDPQGRLVFTVNGTTGVLPASMTETLVARALKDRPDLTKPEGVQAQVAVIEYQHMGDAAVYARRPLTYDPDETVADLLRRAFRLDEPYRRMGGITDTNRLELQVIPETVPEPPRPLGHSLDF